MEAVIYADLAMVAVVAALLGILVAVRIRAQRRRTRLDASRERFELLIAERLASDDQGSVGGRLDPIEERALLEAGLAALLELRGREHERVAELLEEAGVVEAQAATLRHGRVDDRRHAVDVLGLIASPATSAPLRDALADRDVLVRLAAARGLAELGDDSEQATMVAIADAAVAEHHSGAVAELALALGARAPALLGTLYTESASAEVRRIVLAAIGELRLGQHAAILRDALGGDDELAARASRGLGRIGDLESTDALLAVVADTGRSWFVRAAASTALGQLGDPLAVAPLTAELTAEDWPRRRAAAEALAQLGAGGEAALHAALAEPETEAGRHAAAALDR